jgi:uncharacterized membrane protein
LTYKKYDFPYCAGGLMSALAVVRMIAVLSAGLLAGIFLAHRTAAPARAALDASSFVTYQQRVHRTYVKMMPMLLLVAILSAVVWLIMMPLRWQGIEFWLVGLSALGILASAAMTRAVNVPINRQLMTWNPASPPSNLGEIWASWDRVDVVRTAFSMGAFAIQAVVLCFAVA